MVVKLKLSLRERETGRASASPPSRVQTWQAGQNAAAVPVEGVEGEGAETMERAQASQPMPRPPTPLLPGRRLCRTPLSALGDSTPPRNWTGQLVQLWTPPPPPSRPPPSTPPPPSLFLTSASVSRR